MIHHSPYPFTRNPDLEIGLVQLVAAQQCKAQYRTIYNQLTLASLSIRLLTPSSQIPRAAAANCYRRPAATIWP
jgi:hypothetical protein